MHWQDITFLLVGLFLIVLSFLKSKSLANQPVVLSLDKPIAVSFKADRFTLIFLMGVIVSMVGVFFRLKGYEGTIRNKEFTIAQNQIRIEDLEKDVLGIQNKISETLNKELEKNKFHTLSISLVFDSGINPEKYKINVLSKKSTDDEFIPLSNVNFQLGQELNLWGRLNYLTIGEAIRIRAVAPDNTIWTCDDIMIPKNTIRMRKTKKS